MDSGALLRESARPVPGFAFGQRKFGQRKKGRACRTGAAALPIRKIPSGDDPFRAHGRTVHASRAIDMTRAAPASPLLSEFDNFLFASIGNGSNDMPISVLSALARMNLDPWQEAARLTRLPAEKAIRRLATLIIAVPDGQLARLDPNMMAARLIVLLPGRSDANAPLASKPGTSPPRKIAATSHAIFYIAVAIFILAAAYMFSNGSAPQQTDDRSLSNFAVPHETTPAQSAPHADDRR